MALWILGIGSDVPLSWPPPPRRGAGLGPGWRVSMRPPSTKDTQDQIERSGGGARRARRRSEGRTCAPPQGPCPAALRGLRVPGTMRPGGDRCRSRGAALQPCGVVSGHQGRRPTAILPPEEVRAILPEGTGGNADGTQSTMLGRTRAARRARTASPRHGRLLTFSSCSHTPAQRPAVSRPWNAP